MGLESPNYLWGYADYIKEGFGKSKKIWKIKKLLKIQIFRGCPPFWGWKNGLWDSLCYSVDYGEDSSISIYIFYV